MKEFYEQPELLVTYIEYTDILTDPSGDDYEDSDL